MNNEIRFHDEDNVIIENPKGGKNKLAIISLVLAIISIIIGVIPVESEILAIVFFPCLIVGFILAIVALSQIKKKNQDGKVFAVLGLLGTILAFALTIVVGIVQIGNMSEQDKNDALYCPYASECEKGENGISSCIYVDGKNVNCSDSILKNSQYK